MNRKYRKTIIAGNWKMNKTPAETKKMFEELKATCGKQKWCDVVLCVPFVDLPVACRCSRDAKIGVAAQNMHYEEKGAFTGEVSAEMLRELGVKYVVIGHSERREYYAETDKTVNLKVKKALETGLRPIVCVGETLEQREYDVTDEHIAMQVKIALADIPAEKVRKIIFAYEPIWAIGTGKTATSEQANEVCGLIRSVIRAKYGARVARSVTIQYGGSMNPKNAAELLSMPDVDGGLIGGASLKTEDFVAVINAANQ
ncbi:MAG: triose-phosphate isomerase [Oscillospiraceae bacterium]|nr:triose-phosphate isomerase [Oscillospiraceae bacterium]MBQ4316060.1 triose-phosphate isomerase [Oscillospiraceae bacterium]MBQ7054159.1 triose-phosphate isomerase [Oscillospiraceae bacterium]